MRHHENFSLLFLDLMVEWLIFFTYSEAMLISGASKQISSPRGILFLVFEY